MPQNMNAQGIFEILSKQDVSKLAEFIKRLKENQDHDAVDAKIKPVLEDNLVQGQMCGRGKANRKSNKALSNYCCSFPFAMACALAMIILGSLRLDRCNVEKNIPIAMIGRVWICVISQVLTLWHFCRSLWSHQCHHPDFRVLWRIVKD